MEGNNIPLHNWNVGAEGGNYPLWNGAALLPVGKEADTVEGSP